jgi:hypothetical protein
MSDTISTLARQIEDNFVSGLKGLSLAPEEATLVTSVVNRLALHSTMYPTADSTIQPVLKAQIDEDLSTLEQVAVAKQIDAQVLLQRSVYDAVQQFIAFGIKSALAAVA